LLKAERLDKGLDPLGSLGDGWYFGQLPRIFRSPYGKTTSDQKAKFAIAYSAFLARQGENMVSDWQSYVPYSKRAEFAYIWWMAPENDQNFVKESDKMKVAWIHDALLDGNELWWHAFEESKKEEVSSEMVLAHDREQSMVAEYTDVEGHPRSFSETFVQDRKVRSQ